MNSHHPKIAIAEFIAYSSTHVHTCIFMLCICVFTCLYPPIHILQNEVVQQLMNCLFSCFLNLMLMIFIIFQTMTSFFKEKKYLEIEHE